MVGEVLVVVVVVVMVVVVADPIYKRTRFLPSKL